MYSGLTSSEYQVYTVSELPTLKHVLFLLKLYRRSIAEIFRIHVVSNPSVKSPILTLGSTTFFHVRHLNIYIACVTKGNVNAALVFEFCYRLISIGRSYFGKLDEDSVKNNFVLIYELLDGELHAGKQANTHGRVARNYPRIFNSS